MIIHIAPLLIQANPWQPRLNHDPAGIRDLALSIRGEYERLPREHRGLQSPPMARFADLSGVGLQHPLSMDAVYELVHQTEAGEAQIQLAFGHRRLAGFRLLADGDGSQDWRPDERFDEIPLVIAILTDRQMAETAASENIHRVDLSWFEIAKSMNRFIHDFATSQAEAAQIYGLGSQSNAAHYLRAHDAVQEFNSVELTHLVQTGQLGLKHALHLVPLLRDQPIAARQWIVGGSGLYANAEHTEILSANAIREQVDRLLSRARPAPRVASQPMLEREYNHDPHRVRVDGARLVDGSGVPKYKGVHKTHTEVDGWKEQEKVIFATHSEANAWFEATTARLIAEQQAAIPQPAEAAPDALPWYAAYDKAVEAHPDQTVFMQLGDGGHIWLAVGITAYKLTDKIQGMTATLTYATPADPVATTFAIKLWMGDPDQVDRLTAVIGPIHTYLEPDRSLWALIGDLPSAPLPSEAPVSEPTATTPPEDASQPGAPVEAAAPADLPTEDGEDDPEWWQSSASEEWYTPGHIISRARRVLGEIALDPASNWIANKTVRAGRYFDKEQDGLAQEWIADTVWLNPPYGRGIGAWVDKLVDAVEAGQVKRALLLLPARTDTKWFRRLRGYPRCFVGGRLRFRGSKGEHSNAATFPSMIVALGDVDARLFEETFGDVGDIYLLNELCAAPALVRAVALPDDAPPVERGLAEVIAALTLAQTAMDQLGAISLSAADRELFAFTKRAMETTVLPYREMVELIAGSLPALRERVEAAPDLAREVRMAVLDLRKPRPTLRPEDLIGAEQPAAPPEQEAA